MRVFNTAALLLIGFTNLIVFAGQVINDNVTWAALCFGLGSACIFQAGRISEKASTP